MEKRFSEMTQEERLQLFEAERRRLDPLVEKYKKEVLSDDWNTLSFEERRERINKFRSGR